MAQAIPLKLAPYLQISLNSASLTLVTSTLSNPANWLLVRFIQASLQLAAENNILRETETQIAAPVTSVVFICLFRPSDLWAELSKKVGIDLQSLLDSKKVRYVDGLAYSQTGVGSGLNDISLTSLTLEAISAALETATPQASPSTVQNSSYPIVIIDGLDLLLAAQLDVDAVVLQQFVTRIRSRAHSLIITASADSPLLHSQSDSASPLERHHAAFVASTAHQSSWVWQLRGLDTGTARDVTGVLRFSRGGNQDDLAQETSMPDETEWLYHIKGDGSVRIWSRGE